MKSVISCTHCCNYFDISMDTNVICSTSWTFFYSTSSIATPPFIFSSAIDYTFNTSPLGSKTVTRSQNDYFGKGLQVFSPKTNFYMQMNIGMKFFVTFSKKYLNFPQCITFFWLVTIEWIWISKSVQIPYKFNVSSWKIIKNLSHHQKLNFHIL